MEFLGVGLPELLVILVLAVLVVGPQRLPEFAAQLARFMRAFRRYSSRITAEFNETLQELETEYDDMKGEWKDVGQGLDEDFKSVERRPPGRRPRRPRGRRRGEGAGRADAPLTTMAVQPPVQAPPGGAASQSRANDDEAEAAHDPGAPCRAARSAHVVRRERSWSRFALSFYPLTGWFIDFLKKPGRGPHRRTSRPTLRSAGRLDDVLPRLAAPGDRDGDADVRLSVAGVRRARPHQSTSVAG